MRRGDNPNGQPHRNVPEEGDEIGDPTGATGDAPTDTNREPLADRFVERRPAPLAPRPHTARRAQQVLAPAPAGSIVRCPVSARCPHSIYPLPTSDADKIEEIRNNLLIFIERKVTDVEAALASMADIESYWPCISSEDQVRIIYGARHLRYLEFNEAACIQAMLEMNDVNSYFSNMFHNLLGLRCGPY